MSHPQFYDIVKEVWLKAGGNAANSLEQVKSAAILFNKEIFGNIFQRRKHITNRLNGIQKEMERVDSSSLMRTEAELQNEMDQILWREEILWFQKSREQWMQFGDGNTKFFHAQIVIRRKSNKVEGLFLSDGSWSTDANDMRIEALNYFKGLFASIENVLPNSLVF